MKKNNTADFTQFELFDETVTVFEIVQTAEDIRDKLRQVEQNDLDTDFEEEIEKDPICKTCKGGTMTTCLMHCKNYSCYQKSGVN